MFELEHRIHLRSGSEVKNEERTADWSDFIDLELNCLSALWILILHNTHEMQVFIRSLEFQTVFSIPKQSLLLRRMDEH